MMRRRFPVLSEKDARRCTVAVVRLILESFCALLWRQNFRQHETFLARGGRETIIERHDLER